MGPSLAMILGGQIGETRIRNLPRKGVHSVGGEWESSIGDNSHLLPFSSIFLCFLWCSLLHCLLQLFTNPRTSPSFSLSTHVPFCRSLPLFSLFLFLASLWFFLLASRDLSLLYPCPFFVMVCLSVFINSCLKNLGEKVKWIVEVYANWSEHIGYQKSKSNLIKN